MVISRGASDDACLDQKNQASPPHGDESNKRHENADRFDCKINLNSVTSDGNQHVATKVNAASTARDLPPIQLTNTSGLSNLSVNPLLTKMQSVSNQNEKATDALKNLLQTATVFDTLRKVSTNTGPGETSNPATAALALDHSLTPAFKSHAADVLITTAAPGATSAEQKQKVFEAAVDSSRKAVPPPPMFSSRAPEIVIKTNAPPAVNDQTPVGNKRPVTGALSAALASFDITQTARPVTADITPTASTFRTQNAAPSLKGTMTGAGSEANPTPVFAIHQQESVIKTALVASALDQASLTTAKPSNGSLSSSLAHFESAAPLRNVVAEVTPITTIRSSDAPTSAKAAVTGTGLDTTVTPVFALHQPDPVIKTELVKSMVENLKPLPVVLAEVTPTTTMPLSPNSDAVANLKVTASGAVADTTATPIFAIHQQNTAFNTELVASARDQASLVMARPSNGSLSAPLANFETKPSPGVLAEAAPTHTISSSPILDTAANLKVTASGAGADTAITPVFAIHQQDQVIKTELAASTLDQASLANAKLIGSLSSPLANFETPKQPPVVLADATPKPSPVVLAEAAPTHTISSSPILDTAANLKVTASGAGADTAITPVFAIHQQDQVIKTELAASTLDQSSLINAKPSNGSLSSPVANFEAPKQPPVVLADVTPTHNIARSPILDTAANLKVTASDAAVDTTISPAFAVRQQDPVFKTDLVASTLDQSSLINAKPSNGSLSSPVANFEAPKQPPVALADATPKPSPVVFAEATPTHTISSSPILDTAANLKVAASGAGADTAITPVFAIHQQDQVIKTELAASALDQSSLINAKPSNGSLSSPVANFEAPKQPPVALADATPKPSPVVLVEAAPTHTISNSPILDTAANLKVTASGAGADTAITPVFAIHQQDQVIKTDMVASTLDQSSLINAKPSNGSLSSPVANFEAPKQPPVVLADATPTHNIASSPILDTANLKVTASGAAVDTTISPAFAVRQQDPVFKTDLVASALDQSSLINAKPSNGSLSSPVANFEAPKQPPVVLADATPKPSPVVFAEAAPTHTISSSPILDTAANLKVTASGAAVDTTISPAFAVRQQDPVFKTDLVASALDQSSLINAKPSNGSLSSPVANFEAPKQPPVVLADATPTHNIASPPILDTAANSKITASGAAVDTTISPVFAVRQQDPVIKTDLVASTLDQSSLINAKPSNGSLSSPVANFETPKPSPVVLADATPTHNIASSPILDTAANSKVTASGAAVDTTISPAFAVRQQDPVIKTDLVASALDQSSLINAKPSNGSLSSPVANFETPKPSPVVLADATPKPSPVVFAEAAPTHTISSSPILDTAANSKVTASGAAVDTTISPAFAVRQQDPVIKTDLVASALDQSSLINAKPSNGSLSSPVANFEAPKQPPVVLADVTPTHNIASSPILDTAANLKVTASGAAVDTTISPAFAVRQQDPVFKTDLVASTLDQSSLINAKPSNGSLSSPVANFEAPKQPPVVLADVTPTHNIASPPILDTAANSKITASGAAVDTTISPVFAVRQQDPVIKTDLVASALDQSSLINAKPSNGSLSSPVANFETPKPSPVVLADVTPTHNIASSPILDTAANSKVTASGAAVDTTISPAFAVRQQDPVIKTDLVASALDQSSLINAKPSNGLLSSPVANFETPKPSPVVLADAMPTAAASSSAPVPLSRQPDAITKTDYGSLSPVLANYATPDNGAKIPENPAKTVAFTDAAPTRSDNNQPSQVLASVNPAGQLNQAKSPVSATDTSQFNGRYAGPGTTAIAAEQSAQPITTVKRTGSGLARDAVAPEANSSPDATGTGKQFFALPTSGAQNKLSSAESFLPGTMERERVLGKTLEATLGASAVESLKQLMGRQIQDEQTVGGLAADALRLIIARRLNTEGNGDVSVPKPVSSALDYKAIQTNPVAIGTGQILASASSFDSRPGESKFSSINDFAIIRPTSPAPSSETTITGSVSPMIFRAGTASDVKIAQSINIIVGIGTGMTAVADGKTALSDGKTSLIDSRFIGALSPLPAETTNTKKSGETPTSLTGTIIKSTDLTETTTTKKADAIKTGDLLPGELPPKTITSKTGDKKAPEEDDEKAIKNAGTVAGAGGFGGGAANPATDPNSSQTAQTIATGTVIDPDQKITLPNLEIVDGRVLVSGQRNADGDEEDSSRPTNATSRTETENNIDTDKPHSRMDDVAGATINTSAADSIDSVKLSEVDRLFAIPKTQPNDQEVAWQAGQWQTEFLSFERRRVYKIKRGESLADIARRELGNSIYVQLLIEINIDTLIFDRYGQIVLTPGREIFLPSRADILRFHAYQEQENKLLLAFVDEKNIDTNQQVVYACRLGDTLTSVAKRHPAVRDARLWKLIAELNDLSTKKDKKGAPIATLQRGQHLLLPTAEQKSDYLHELTFGTKSKDLSSDFVRHITDVQAPESKAKTTLGDKAITTEPDTSFESRLVSQSDLGDTGDSLVLRLELRVEGKFVPVVEYSIGFGSANLCVHTKNGESKVTSIDLPNRSARELAESDLAANANLYCQNFENNVLPL